MGNLKHTLTAEMNLENTMLSERPVAEGQTLHECPDMTYRSGQPPPLPEQTGGRGGDLLTGPQSWLKTLRELWRFLVVSPGCGHLPKAPEVQAYSRLQGPTVCLYFTLINTLIRLGLSLRKIVPKADKVLRTSCWLQHFSRH